MHDKFVERTTNGRGRVQELTWGELRTLDAGGGECIPLLEDALAAVNGRIGIILEAITPGVGGDLYHATSRAKLTSPVIFASFLHAEMLAIRNLAPSAETMALMECVPLSGAAFATRANATHVGLSLDSTTREFVVDIQDSGLQVFLYTANEPWLIEEAIELEVDGIISDFPDRVAECIARRRSESA